MFQVENNIVPAYNVTEEVSKRIIGKITWKDETFKLPDHISSMMEEDKAYILTCFWTNAYIKYEGEGQFATTNVFGDPLQTEREYLIINPAY